jgi:phage terminase large subunit-like protein
VAQVWEQPRGELSHFLILRHQERGLLGFDEIVVLLTALHEQWQSERIWIENERLGQATLDQLRHALPIELVPTRGKDKATRASTLILKFSRGEIFLPKYESTWLPDFQNELFAWTGKDDQPADQIDAAAYAAIISQTAAPGILVIEHISHQA